MHTLRLVSLLRIEAVWWIVQWEGWQVVLIFSTQFCATYGFIPLVNGEGITWVKSICKSI